jgi:hypothetical protein
MIEPKQGGAASSIVRIGAVHHVAWSRLYEACHQGYRSGQSNAINFAESINFSWLQKIRTLRRWLGACLPTCERRQPRSGSSPVLSIKSKCLSKLVPLVGENHLRRAVNGARSRYHGRRFVYA